jgi:hypothetical protein
LTVRAELAAKPWALMVVLVPTVPVVGLRPVAEAVTVKEVVEVAVFDEVSVTVTVWAPLGTLGTVKVTVDEPLVPVVAPEVMVAVVPSTLTVRAELAAKPWALMVVLVPTGPVVVVRPVAEALTVKLAEAFAPPVSVAVMVFTPLVAVGTVKVADQEPLEPTVGLAGLSVRADPAKVADTVLPAM